METTSIYLVLFLTVLITNVKGSGITCERNYDKIGCYDEYNPGIKDLIVYDRFGIQWEKIEAFMHSLACRCEAKARALNKERSESEKYVGFALHFWGECYGRTQAQINSLALKSISGRCTGDQTYTKCYDKNQECTGHAFSEFVYNIKPGKGETQIRRNCKEDTFKISCSKGLRITLIKLSYGEKTTDVCGSPLSVGWKANCAVVQHETFANYYARCFGAQTCEIAQWKRDPNDPCPDVEKYINAEYQCKE